MGNARWNSADYDSYAQTTNYRSMSRDQVFEHRMDPMLDPRNVKVGKGVRQGLQLRESIISDENPNPTPIILGLDVTGSMRDVVEIIAKDELPRMMTEIHTSGAVQDPHIMFMGIDDVHVQGHGALQVSYFEPDLRIIEQIRKLWLVGNGGGNSSESYDLAWYFAAKHTYLDSLAVQGRKGLLFTIGDEDFPFRPVTGSQLNLIFGGENYESVNPEDALRMAQESYDVFHISICSSHRSARGWDDALGANHLRVEARNVRHLTEVIIAVLRVMSGADIMQVVNESAHSDILKVAFGNALKAL